MCSDYDQSYKVYIPSDGLDRPRWPLHGRAISACILQVGSGDYPIPRRICCEYDGDRVNSLRQPLKEQSHSQEQAGITLGMLNSDRLDLGLFDQERQCDGYNR